MAASSIMTPSQSGILGEGGKKVLKTRVLILGRFLMEPGEAFSQEAAARMTERAKSRKVRVRTQLTVFSSGLRLGERGIFAALPFEFIRYSRLADMLGVPRFPSVLVICVRDYDQRSATVVQFKDDVCLRVVVDVIDRHRRALEEDVAHMSDLQSIASELKGDEGTSRSAKGVGSGPGLDSGDGNWQFRPAVEASRFVNGSTVADENHDHRISNSASVSTLIAEEGDYAIIRGSRVPRATAAANVKPLPMESMVMDENDDHVVIRNSRTSAPTVATNPKPLLNESILVNEDDDYALIRRSRALVATTEARPKRPLTPQRPQLAQQNDEDRAEQLQVQQSQNRYQKNPHHHPNQLHPQQLQRNSLTFLQVEDNHSGSRSGAPQRASALDFDTEVETAAVFETPHGPPTLLNELVRRRGDDGGSNDGIDGGGGGGWEVGGVSRSRLMAELPPEFVAHVQVRRRSDAAPSGNGGWSTE